jgi:hypothetical protein
MNPSHLLTPSPERESASVAFEQAAWWRLRGLTAAEACDALGIAHRCSWEAVEAAIRRRWREAVQIKANRDHRSAA